MPEMYNQERKEAFLKEYAKNHSKATLKFAIDTFRSCAKFEDEVGMDICIMPSASLERIVESQVGLNSATKWTRLGVLKEYIKWCIASKVPGANNSIMEIDPHAGTTKIRNRMVSGPMQLKRWMDIVFPEVEKDTIQVCTCCYYWLAFLGVMSGREAAIIKKDQVDLVNRIVNYHDRELEIYTEAMPVFKKAVELEYLRYLNGNYNKFADGVLRKRVDSDLLLRGMRASPGYQTLRRMSSSAAKRAIEAGETEVRLSFDNIYLSGVFYRMFQRESAGYLIDFTDIALEQHIHDNPDCLLDANNANFKAYIRRRKLELLDEYNRWKITFY